MSTNAVTPGTSAVSEREPSSRFLPTDKKYRMTGELPDADLEVAGTQVDTEEHIPEGIREEREQEKQPAKTDASAASSETAAASEAAPQQKEETKGPAQTKTAATSETRWQKITRENKELRERLNKLEAQPQQQRETRQESQPATETKPKAAAKPKIDDVDPKTGKPVYANWQEYEEAKDKWNRAEARREFQEESAKSAAEQAQHQLEQTVRETVHERVEKARKQYPDYDSITDAIVARKDQFGNDALFFVPQGHIDRFLYKSERGAEILYHIAKNFDDPAIQAIFARDPSGKNYLMNGVDQLYELAKIEHSLPAQSASAPPAKPVTQAPRPPHQVSGKGTVTKDAVTQAVEDGDTETYIREQNRLALARRKGK